MAQSLDAFDKTFASMTTKLCFCCLADNETLINVENCRHNEFLQEFIENDSSNVVVCNICHTMLKKIFIFKEEVNKSSKMLYAKSKELIKQKNLFNLQRSCMNIDTFTPEFRTENYENFIESNIKIENEIIIDTKEEESESETSSLDDKETTYDDVDMNELKSDPLLGTKEVVECKTEPAMDNESVLKTVLVQNNESPPLKLRPVTLNQLPPNVMMTIQSIQNTTPLPTNQSMQALLKLTQDDIVKNQQTTKSDQLIQRDSKKLPIKQHIVLKKNAGIQKAKQSLQSNMLSLKNNIVLLKKDIPNIAKLKNISMQQNNSKILLKMPQNYNKIPKQKQSPREVNLEKQKNSSMQQNNKSTLLELLYDVPKQQSPHEVNLAKQKSNLKLRNNNTTLSELLQKAKQKSSSTQQNNNKTLLKLLQKDIGLRKEKQSPQEKNIVQQKNSEKQLKDKRVKKIPPLNVLKDKHLGKVKLVILSEKEIAAERQVKLQNENFLKMPFKCKSCIKCFDDETCLQEHIDGVHEYRGKMKEGLQECNICKMKLESGRFIDHMDTHIKRFECLVCGMRSGALHKVSEHYNQEHGQLYGSIDLDYKCELCDYASDSHSVYRYHHRNKHNIRECPICEKRLSTAAAMDNHMKRVHKIGVKVYTCAACEVPFKRKIVLIWHMSRMHGGDLSQRTYCHPCRTCYVDIPSLQEHLSSDPAHAATREKYECNECESIFFNKSYLEAHINSKHKIPLIKKCPTCLKIFDSVRTYLRHIRTAHQNREFIERDIVCEHCGKAFFNRQILKSHIRIHTGERPYICNTCGATFKQSGALYTHTKLKHKTKLSTKKNKDEEA